MAGGVRQAAVARVRAEAGNSAALPAGTGAGKKRATFRGTPMASLILFVFFILGSLLNLLKWAVIISAIISWLVAFDVINLRNRAVYSISRFLDAVTAPLLAPLRRVIPPLGGVDITPIILFLIIVGVQSFLLYPLRGALLSLLG